MKMKSYVWVLTTLLLTIAVFSLQPAAADTTPPLNLTAITDVYPLDAGALTKLYKNGFIVLKNEDAIHLSEVYMALFDRSQVSVFITSDVMLHIFHNVQDEMLKDIERTHLYDTVQYMVKDLQLWSMADYDSTSATLTHVKEAARRDVIFFTVACKLLDDTYPVPTYADAEVTSYVQKILDHNIAEFYPGDDYTQYEPRGHYEGDPQLERYFRCVKWLSRRIFRLEDYKYPDDSHIEMIQAVMIAKMLVEIPWDCRPWQEVYDVTTLLVGTADSITPPMVQQAVNNVFGNFSIAMLEDVSNIEKLREEFWKPEYPVSEIIPVPLEYPGQIPPKYVQFMGERYVPDSYVFQQDTFPYIADLTRLPKALEIMTTMLDSERADYLLEGEKRRHPNLAGQMEMLKAKFDAYTEADWTRTVYCNWLYTLEPLLIDFGTSYPEFMQTTAWLDEKLNTCLSSWTQLRHDYILYAKQTYIPSPAADGYGYVEPVPEFYARLAALCRKIVSEMESVGVLSPIYEQKLKTLAYMLDTFQKYAEKILRGEQLTGGPGIYGGEQGDIHQFGLWLLGFFSEGELGEKEPTLVADVCTNSTTFQVLHEGVGKFNPIIIVYQQPDGKTLAGIGYVMSYYEFREENFNRLSDSEWKKLVESGQTPPRPLWAASFLYPADKPQVSSTDLIDHILASPTLPTDLYPYADQNSDSSIDIADIIFLLNQGK